MGLASPAPGCSCEQHEQPGGDASSDAGRADAAVDAELSDAEADAARDPDDPVWVRMPGLPEEYCWVERAEHPEVLFEPSWEPCPGVDGCLMLVQRDELLRSYSAAFSGHDGERGYFQAVQAPRLRAPRVTVLAATEGAPLAAWREPTMGSGDGRLCAVFPTGLSADGASAFFAILSHENDSPLQEQRVYHAPAAEIGRATEPVAVLTAPLVPGLSFATRGDVSATTVALEIQSVGFVAVLSRGVVRRMEPLPTGEGEPQVPFVVGDDVFWHDFGSRVRIAHGSIDEPTGVFLEVAGADVLRPASDGTDLAWVVGYSSRLGGPYERTELWSSPYSADPAVLQPRLVAEVGVTNIPSDAIVASGMYGFTISDGGARNRVVVFDLATGARREIELPEGHQVRPPLLYLTPDELAVATAATVFRIELGALQTVPPPK